MYLKMESKFLVFRVSRPNFFRSLVLFSPVFILQENHATTAYFSQPFRLILEACTDRGVEIAQRR